MKFTGEYVMVVACFSVKQVSHINFIRGLAIYEFLPYFGEIDVQVASGH